MPVRLKSPNAGYPPGEFSFSDPHTGMQFNDPAADLNHQVKLVIEHRKGNPKIYQPEKADNFDPKIVETEIIIQVCARNPSLCEDDAFPGQPYPRPPAPPEPTPVFRQAGKVCAKCGSQDFEVQYCKTCGGGKINGYKCLSCGLVS